MTKLSFKYIVTAVLTVVFSSCTLMLEEPPAPDEEILEPSDTGDGITTPRVTVDEFGRATYQFNEGVRVIDESYLPYLISAEKKVVSDTVLNKSYLYFAKNIPADMIPQRGDLIGTQNVPLIDFALVDQVDAVEAEGPYYKVTSHVVALDKIFKVLEGDFYFDIVADADSATFQNSRSGEGSGGAHFEGGYFRNARSRASDEDILTGNKPIATVAVSSAGTTKPQDIFETLKDNIWDKSTNSLERLNHIKTTVSGTNCDYFLGQQVYSTLHVNLSLLGFEVSMGNTVKTSLGIDGKKFSGSTSMGLFCTDGSDVESDGFFPANSFNKIEYMNELPDILAIPVTIGIPMTITFGCSWINDLKFELQSSQNFHFETTFTDSNFQFAASDKEAAVKKKNGGVKHKTTENEGTTKFKYGIRNTFEVMASFSLGAGDATINKVKEIMKAQTLKGKLKNTGKNWASDQLPSFTPLVVRLLFTYKDVNFSDNTKVTPSTISYKDRTYKCGGNSWRDRSLWIGVGARFCQIKGLGTTTGAAADVTLENYGSEDLKKACDWLSRFNDLLSTGVASGKIWSKHTSKYATFEHSVKLYEDNKDNNTQTYRITLTPGTVDDSHITESFTHNRCFSRLQLFILDQNGKVITLAKPTDTWVNVDLKNNFYRSFDPGKSYEFEVTLNKSNITGGFMAAPAYCESTNYTNPDDMSGWGTEYMFDVPFQASANSSAHITAKSRLCQKGAQPYYLPDEQPVAVIFDIDYTIAADIFNKDMIRNSRNRNIEIRVSSLDAAGKPLRFYNDRSIPIEKRGGKIKLMAFFLKPEEKGIKQVRITAIAPRWTEGFFSDDYEPITLIDRTFDVFVPKDEEYLLTKEDIEKYKSQGYYNMFVE